MKNTRLVAVNTEILDTKDMDFPVHDAGYLYGFGLFETVLVYEGKIPFLGYHYSRLSESAKVLGIPIPLSITQVKETLEALIARTNTDTAKLNLYLSAGDKEEESPGFVFRDPKLISVIRPYNHHAATSVHLCINRLDHHPHPLACHKSLSYAPYILAQQKHAPKTALITSPDGHILESPTAAICCIKDKTLIFPKIDASAHHYRLNSVSEAVIKVHASDWGFTIDDRPIHLDDLASMDEIFCCNAVQGLIPVTDIQGYDEDLPLKSGAVVETLLSNWDALLG